MKKKNKTFFEDMEKVWKEPKQAIINLFKIEKKKPKIFNIESLWQQILELAMIFKANNQFRLKQFTEL